uniref:Ovate family protein n=2 Tax=Zea mays TaxID=4577 RepID=A0A804PRA8_MAIZE
MHETLAALAAPGYRPAWRAARGSSTPPPPALGAGNLTMVTMAVWVRGLGVRVLLDPVDADSLRPYVNIIFACPRREKQQPPLGHRLARMFCSSLLLCSTCNNTDVASSSYYTSPAGNDQGSSSRALLVVNGAIDRDLFVASLRRDLSAEPSRSPLLSTTSAMVVSTTEEQVHRGFTVVKRSRDPYNNFHSSMVAMIM